MGKKPGQKSAVEAKKKPVSKVEKVKKTAKAVVKVAAAEAAANDRSQTLQSEACKIKGCKREYRAKGYCKAHYKKWRQGEYGVARYTTCSSTECRKPMALNRHGYCEDHFQKFYVKGETAPVVAAPAKPADKTAEAS